MASMSNHFRIDINKGLSKPEYIFKGQKYRITVLSDVLIRFEYSETGTFNDYPTIQVLNRNFGETPNISVKQDDKFLNIQNNYFILEYSKEKPFEAGKLVPDSNMRVSLVGTDKVWYYNHPEVRNFKGAAYSFDMDKHGFKVEKGLYSTDGFATINDTGNPVFVADGSVKKNPSDGIDIYLFIYRKDFGKALKSYFELTGYPGLIPRYALGVWWNKNEEYNENDVENLIENFDKSEVPISSILLGKSWNKVGVKNYEFDREKFPNVEKLIKDMHDKKIYLGVGLNTDYGFKDTDSFYNKAKEITNSKDSTIPFNVYNTELLNEFYNSVIDPLLDLGVDYFWLDENKKDKISAFMLTHFTFMNYSRKDTRRGLVMARNSLIASHRYPVMFSGNTKVSWKTLRYLPFYNSMSANIGLSWWSHDIGGYEGGIEDKELYTRYVQLGVYSPVFRFASKAGHYYKREPWKWDNNTKTIVRSYTRMRHKLIPYIYTEAYKYYKLGMPLIQPIYYRNPEVYDEPLYKNEYYFGTELLVAPITTPKDSIMNRVVHKIFLPEGIWYDIKTGKKFPGGRYVTFYKDEDYPVYARSGAIIPIARLDKDNINDVHPPKELEIQVFPGCSNSYNLYEDDGVSNLYKEGFYIITNIDYNYRKNNYTLIIRPIDGKSNIIPEKRNYKIRFRNTKNPEDVKVNIGKFDKEYESYTTDNDFIIEIKDVPTTQQLTINCGGKAIEIDAVRLINEDIDDIISDLQIETTLKETIAGILFSDDSIRKKRISIRKLRSKGLKGVFIKMFLKLLEYISEI